MRIRTAGFGLIFGLASTLPAGDGAAPGRVPAMEEARSAQAGAAAAVRAAAERQRARCRAATAAAVAVQRSTVRRPDSGWAIADPRPANKSADTDPPRFTADFVCRPMSSEELEPLIRFAAAREELPSSLLEAVIRQESGFHPCAVSAKGALGLMQLMPLTAARFGVQDPFDPKENIASGAKFLREMLVRYGGDLELALGAYNAGPSRVDAAGGLPQIPETVRYVNSVMKMLREGARTPLTKDSSTGLRPDFGDLPETGRPPSDK